MALGLQGLVRWCVGYCNEKAAKQNDKKDKKI